MVTHKIIQFIQKHRINRLIVHGLKISNHTHRFIHESMYNTFVYIASIFQHYQIEVFWCDDIDSTKHIYSPIIYNPLNNFLIFSTPHLETDIYLPLLDNAYYILHYRKCKVYSDIPITKYDNLLLTKRAVKYVEFRYSPDNIDYHPNNMDGVIEIDKTPFWFDTIENEAHLAWATNLLPADIDINIEKIRASEKPLFILQSYFCGSVWRVNNTEIECWKKICESRNINCIIEKQLDEQIHQKNVMKSYLSIAIQGETQREQSNKYYIPCRIFKNISYGAIPITNNIGVYNMLNGFRVIYDVEPDKLIEKSIERYHEIQNNYQEYKDAQIIIMEYVRDHHTYLNRIATCIQYGFAEIKEN